MSNKQKHEYRKKLEMKPFRTRSFNLFSWIIKPFFLLFHHIPIIGFRHIQVFLLFIMIFTALGFNVTLSVTIVAMTDPKASSNSEISTYYLPNKGLILSAFFWGYVWPQVFAGYAATRFGAKWFLIAAMLIQSLLGIFMPLTVAYFGSLGMCISRAVQGFSQGFLFPSLSHLLGQWVPREERTRLGAFAFGAVPLGIVVAMLLSGMVSASSYGWPLAFYIYGVIGLSWCILFTLFGFNNPAEHPFVSEAERFFITRNLEQNYSIDAVPWLKIFKSGPVWALFITQSGYIYCTSTFFSQIPTYLDHVIKLNIRNNGLLSALPFFTLWILSFVFSYFSDCMINKRIVSVGTARKLFNTLGLVGSAISMVFLAHTENDHPTRALILLVCSTGALSSCMSGWSINHIDLSPKFAGTLMGLTNGFAHISAILSPIIVQILVPDLNNSQQWRSVFLMAAAIELVAAIYFILWGSGDIQPWNESIKKEEGDYFCF
ncbi:hypothetical protein ABEB36_004069 [Hypothenemus hampei]|uniref:Putative inorganic phosphate cotransporter n=1 Tax=Hypothenemus hampei TaxID=57062 RepID=A0ABD1F226_HYPHA